MPDSVISTTHSDQERSQALYRHAVLMVITGGVLLSLLGIGVRLIDSASSWQIMFYRSVTQALFLTLIVTFTQPKQRLRAFTSMGSKGFMASVCLGGASLFMILAVRHTSVANAVAIIALAPLCAALLGLTFLKEAVSNITWFAMLLAFIGIGLVFHDGLYAGGLLGMGFAFCMMFLYSSSLVLIRAQHGANMYAVCALSGAILALGVLPWLSSFSLSVHDLLICVFLGVFQIGLGMVLVTRGAEHVPAAQVSLLALLEVVLSPVWVWLLVNETPSGITLLGGAIVLFGVALQARFGQRARLLSCP